MKTNRRSHWTSWLSYAWLICFTTLGLAVLLRPSGASSFRANGEGQTVPLSGDISSIESTPAPLYGYRNIEDIRVGQRVMASNPEVSDIERASWEEPDWSQWHCATLEMTKPDGGVLKIEMIRPREWFELETRLLAPEHQVPGENIAADNDGDYLAFALESLVGEEVWLDLMEMGAEGPARVLSISDCPRVESGAGQVVTATFAHPPSTEVLDVQFEGETRPVGVTDNHLFWSVEFEEFLPIGQLSVGDRVLTYSGDTKRIESKLPRPGPDLVYNIEVHGEHVFSIGDYGLTVHNSCARQDTYIVYQITEPQSGRIYTGISHGTGSVEQILRKRFRGGHHTGLALRDARVVHQTFSRAEARGMEHLLWAQQRLRKNAFKQNNPIGDRNKNAEKYIKAAAEVWARKFAGGN